MKQKRKLSSFTLSQEITDKLEIISNQEGINKSRMIEKIINDYSNDKNTMYVYNSAGPIAIPIDEIAIKVSKIIKYNE